MFHVNLKSKKKKNENIFVAINSRNIVFNQIIFLISLESKKLLNISKEFICAQEKN